jgi:flagellar biosynthetic protein FliR
MQPQAWGAEIFGIGLWIALPLVGMLLFVNLVLGVISRVAPQINVFSIGFPITLGVGLLGMLLTLPMMEALHDGAGADAGEVPVGPTPGCRWW